MPLVETPIAPPGIATPCRGICVLEQRSRLCAGCGRSIDEISRWTALDDTQRATIMTQLPARLAALTAARVATQV